MSINVPLSAYTAAPLLILLIAPITLTVLLFKIYTIRQIYMILPITVLIAVLSPYLLPVSSTILLCI